MANVMFTAEYYYFNFTYFMSEAYLNFAANDEHSCFG